MSDRGERYTDKKIAQTDRKLLQTYKQAERELKQKLKDFNQKFTARDKAKRKAVKDGEISEQQYKDWLAGQVFQREQWKTKISQVQQVLLRHDKFAAAMINDGRFDVFAENYYSSAFRASWITQGVDFNIYNTQALERLIEDDPDLLPEWKIDQEKDYEWSAKKVSNIVQQGIIQGESIDQITDRLCRDLCAQDANRMRLFARTAMTGAQNAGRQLQMQQAADMGIEVNKRWIATLDSRTRDSHRHLDGEEVPQNEDFSNGLEYPGDPSGDPEEVYNCRCTMQSVYPKYEDRSKQWREGVEIDGQSYEDWKEHKKRVNEQPYYPASDRPDLVTKAREQSELSKEVAEIIKSKGFVGKVDKKYVDDILSSLTKSEKEALELIRDTYNNLTEVEWRDVPENPKINSHYDPNTGKIVMYQKDFFGNEISPKEQTAVFWHEYGHFLDDARRSQSGFGITTQYGYRLNGIHWEVNQNDAWCIAAQKDISNFLRSMNVDQSYDCRFKSGQYSAWMYKDGNAINPSVFNVENYDVLHGALAQWAHDFSEADKANNYLYDQGLPRMPDMDKFIETYFTPRRNLYRERERYPGAREEYYRLCYETDEKQKEFWNTHDMEKLLEEQHILLEIAESRKLALMPATDTFDGSCSGFFRSDMQIGGHEPDYYGRQNNGLHEGIANVFSTMVTRDGYTIEAMKRLCPETYKLIRSTIRRGK